MRVATWKYCLTLALFFGSACGQKGAKLQKSVIPPDKTLFENGDEYLRKNQYIKARLSFQTLINTYPDSELQSESFLAIGDSFYREGGSENMLQAEDQFKNFIVFFPAHPKTADAQLKIIAINMKQMRAPDRDTTHAVRAEAEIRRFLNEYPDSEFVPIVREYLNQVQENLALGHMGVAKFYAESTKNHAAAASRLREVSNKYKNFSGMDEIYHRLAQSLEETENSEEAAIYLTRLAKGFPFSPFFDEAKLKLEDMGKPVPEVDMLLAAKNEGLLPEEQGFSVLSPFVNFATAMGFKRGADPYENARKQVEVRRALAEAELASAEGDAGAEGASGDVAIEAVLTKTKSGETTVEVGSKRSNPNAAEASSDKNDDSEP